MFELFTEGSRRATALAMEEARHFGHNYVGTEHLLLGLLREDEGVAAQALTSLNVTLNELREQLESIVGYSSKQQIGNHFPFTPRSKKVFELGLLSARSFGEEECIDTEHLLLALVAERDGLAARMLDNLGAEPTEVVSEVLRRLGNEDNAETVYEELGRESSKLRDTVYEHSPYATAGERLRGTVLYPSLAALTLASVVGVAVYIAVRLALRSSTRSTHNPRVRRINSR